MFIHSEVPERRRTRGKMCQKTEESAADLVFNVEAHSGKELRHFKFLSVSFMGQLLCSSSFVGKVSCFFLIKPIVVWFKDFKMYKKYTFTFKIYFDRLL